MNNWNLEDVSRLQLPHREHPEESHESSIYTIQVRGRHLVSGSADRSIRIWDIETQRLLRPALRGHEASVLCLQFEPSPQEDIIISGSVDASIIVWRFTTGEIIRRIRSAHLESVLSLYWDDRYLVTGSKDKSIKLWARQTVSAQDDLIPEFVRTTPPLMEEDLMIPEYSHLATLKKHQAAVNDVKIIGDKIISGGGDRVIHVWSLHSGEVVQTFKMHKKGISCLWSNARFVVAGSSDQTVSLIDMDDEREVARLEGYSNLVRSLQVVNEHGNEPSEIVTGSYDGQVKVWRRASSSSTWAVTADFLYGSLQPRVRPDDEETKQRKFLEPFRVFKVQVANHSIFCSGEGTVIEGWKFQSKTP